MDISSVTAASDLQAFTQDQVGVAMLRKTLDIQAQQGADLAKMVAQAAGVGQRVDQYA